MTLNVPCLLNFYVAGAAHSTTTYHGTARPRHAQRALADPTMRGREHRNATWRLSEDHKTKRTCCCSPLCGRVQNDHDVVRAPSHAVDMHRGSCGGSTPYSSSVLEMHRICTRPLQVVESSLHLLACSHKTQCGRQKFANFFPKHRDTHDQISEIRTTSPPVEVMRMRLPLRPVCVLSTAKLGYVNGAGLRAPVPPV